MSLSTESGMVVSPLAVQFELTPVHSSCQFRILELKLDQKSSCQAKSAFIYQARSAFIYKGEGIKCGVTVFAI